MSGRLRQAIAETRRALNASALWALAALVCVAAAAALAFRTGSEWSALLLAPAVGFVDRSRVLYDQAIYGDRKRCDHIPGRDGWCVVCGELAL